MIVCTYMCIVTVLTVTWRSWWVEVILQVLVTSSRRWKSASKC